MKINLFASPLAIVWRLTIALAVAISTVAAARPLDADGWHNASLSTASLDEWMNDIKTQVPQVSSQLDKSSLKSGQGPEELRRLAEEAARQGTPPKAGDPPQAGKINANFTPEQVALLGRKANDCLEIMAFMDNRNIFPREFPRFQLDQIPNYRKNAKALLNAMGPVGSKAVVETVRSHLMGNPPPQGFGLELHANYFQDLIDVLKQSASQGDLTSEDFRTLREASQGQKTPAVAALASKLDDVFASVPIPSLLDWIEQETDARAKAELGDYLAARVSSASQAELMTALSHEGLSPKARMAISNEVKKSLPNMNVVELLSIMDSELDAALQRAAAETLQKMTPSYSDVQELIPQIHQFTNSKRDLVNRFAQWHLANAFQRAPMVHCMYWLGQGNPGLNTAIWEQVDARIARADSARRTEYYKVAEAVLNHEAAKPASKTAALSLFVKLNDRQAVTVILDQLALMPRELWPAAGQSLAALTGQDFGPKQGDGVAEVTVAIKRWRQWWNENN